MKILLFGPHGQVGFELQRALAPLGDVILCDRSRVDLTHTEALDTFIRQTAPHMIVNAAAYTQVDQAENDEAIAQCINATVPGVMAKAAAELGCWLVHYSTDYVFDGTKKSPYLETDPVNPINIYGKTKADGEALIRKTGCRHLILRTSWVYSTRGKNFVRTILRLAQTNEQLKIVNDQMGAPTSAELIADISALMIYRIITDNTMHDFTGGTFHLTATGATSWQGFAQYIINTAHQLGASLKTTQILGIATEQYPTPAKRPKNSQLSTQKLGDYFGLQLPEWQGHVDRVLSVLCERGY